MKAKRVGKNDANTKKISWDTRVSKRPSKPNLPAVPKPSKLLLQQGYAKPLSCLTL